MIIAQLVLAWIILSIPISLIAGGLLATRDAQPAQ